MMNKGDAIVATYQSQAGAEAAVKELNFSGFDMQNISIAASGCHTDNDAVGFYHSEGRMKYWGVTGAFWGGIWGLLFGSAFFFIPGVGPLLVAGPLVCSIIGALDGALVTGATSPLQIGLFTLGVPENYVLQCETGIKSGKYVLIAHGTVDEMSRVRAVLGRIDPGALEEHQLLPTGTEAALVEP